ncbi:hypothetical protein ACFO0N_12215 [Halobium salinum]|uniref:DUF7835 domain-containing protein n=1 Tax=Halobium salinum TaxID=1364940 RepID=A0ABD5PCS1_9EURY|nr:hypothetical protein [Halobium salinum]
MATKHPRQQLFVEPCEACGDDTPHDVSISIVTESKKKANTEFSREPYRVTVCSVCGLQTQQRMNNV